MGRSAGLARTSPAGSGYAVCVIGLKRRLASYDRVRDQTPGHVPHLRGQAGVIPQLEVAAPREVAGPRVFVNRVGEQADLAAAALSGVVVVAGRSGIGKTWLARKWLADLVVAKAYDVCVYLEIEDRGREL